MEAMSECLVESPDSPRCCAQRLPYAADGAIGRGNRRWSYEKRDPILGSVGAACYIGGCRVLVCASIVVELCPFGRGSHGQTLLRASHHQEKHRS